MKIDLFPKLCNLCGGEVEYVTLEEVYGNHLKFRKGSGHCYRCKNCGATVGTHKDCPLEAYGLLANDEMCKLRQRNHALFDQLWRDRAERTKYYHRMADEMGIPFEECHFGYFNIDELNKSYDIIMKFWREKYDR